MARVAFFTENLPPQADLIGHFAYDLMRSLGDQGHELKVFTTYRQGQEIPPPHPRIEILQPFRRWSWTEIPRILPLLLQFQPEILHIIQPHADALRGLTNAMGAIPSLTPFLRSGLSGSATVSTFFDLNEHHLVQHRMLLQTSQIVTVSNEQQKEKLAAYLGSGHRARIEVVPISSSLDFGEAALNETLPLEWTEFFARRRPWFFVPGQMDEHSDLDHLFDLISAVLSARPQTGVVFGGSWGSHPVPLRHKWMRRLREAELDHRILWTGPLDQGQLQNLLAQADLVMLPTLQRETLAFTRVLRLALQMRSVLLLSKDQSRLDPLPWKDGTHARLTSANLQETAQAAIELLDSPETAIRMRAALGDFSQREVVDQPGNVMSRLYAQALSPGFSKTRS
jgi:glycosyltransferase involved in cell wall biosynthesis